jgi:outer membrane receptor protein involved in Fe transport
VQQTWIFDGQASYQLDNSVTAESAPATGDAKDGADLASHISSGSPWRRMWHDTTLTIGCNNLFGQDPPTAFLSNAGYADFIYDSVGRFVYVSVKKRF